MPKSSKAADLLKVLGQKTPSLETPPKPAAATPTATQGRTPKRRARKTTGVPVVQDRAAAPGRTRGKPVQLYLHDEDQRLIRELAVWLAPHRKRINDSLIVKTALRAAKTGPELLAAYDDAVKVDGRTRRKVKEEL
jgi:hypothetical protein